MMGYWELPIWGILCSVDNHLIGQLCRRFLELGASNNQQPTAKQGLSTIMHRSQMQLKTGWLLIFCNEIPGVFKDCSRTFSGIF